MSVSAPSVILTAGTLTFTNEWYQTKQVNWRIPVATLIGAAIVDGISQLNNNAAVGLSAMVFIGAITTKFNGRSIADTVTEITKKSGPTKKHAEAV